jgi:K+-transporting ATPase ATPase A chain
VLPFNPQHLAAASPDLAFNTAISFVSNTNWQSYVPETTMSYLTQMMGLTMHNFVSAATGVALAVALVRGFARRSAKTVGNFWADLVRCTLYVLLPISVVVGLFFVWQGMPQNLHAYVDATTLEGAKQTIAQGPVASQEVIKMLGTNGGGFFNANSAHPYENPNALTNLVEMILIFSIGAALTNMFGRMVGDERQGWAIFAVMGFLFLAGAGAIYAAEAPGNPAFAAMHIDQAASALQAGGNMEGKEVRFGIANSSLFANVTTDASCGAVNAMHDSLMPLAGMIPIVNMMLGEIIFGGVGSGLYGMLLFAILAVFIAGLMVGRTPEYLGKKIEAREVKMAMLAILVLPLSILGFTALAVVLRDGLAGPLNSGPHGYSEILYAYTSATANNGSAFAGLTANTPFYNSTLGFDARFRDADRPLPDDRTDAGSRRIAGGQEDRAAVRRHVPNAWRIVRWPSDRRHPDSWRPDLFPGALARPDRRVSGDERRSAVLRKKNHEQDTQQSVHHGQRHSSPRHPGGVHQAQSPRDGAQSGDVRGGDRGHADHDPLHPRSDHSYWRSPFLVPDQSVALVHGAVRQFRRSRRGRPRQGAGGKLAQDQDRSRCQASG